MTSLFGDKLWAKGKRPHKFTYTYQDIADLTHHTLSSIRAYASRKKFNPRSLESVVRFIAEKL